MPLEIPVDLPGHPFSDQLVWIANWAGISKTLLLENESDLAMAFNKGSVVCVSKLKEFLPNAPWVWPAYQAMIDVRMASQETLCSADEVRFFSRDELTDMAECIYEKLQSRRMALYRLGQMDSVKHLRPYWQIVGKCAGEGAECKTLFANDPFWNGKNVPWNCVEIDCKCRIHSLSRIELQRYVEGGCAKGDEAAAMLKIDYQIDPR